MATELIGTIHQFLNNCKDTIVSWCKDAAKTVCLPLSGGSMNSGANITTTGTVNAGKITVDTDSALDNAQLFLKGTRSPCIFERVHNLEAGANATYPSSTVDVGGLWVQDKNNLNLGLYNFRIGSDFTETWMCVHNYLSTGSHGVIGVIHKKDKGFYTECVNPNSNITSTNQIATTGWVNQVLANITKSYNSSTSVRYVKFPNGTMICAGYAGNVKAGSTITYPVAFKTPPVVLACRHWGGNGDASVGATSTVGSAPVQVYNTIATSFRIGVHTATSADASTYTNGTNTICAMWLAFGEWK